MFQKHNICNHYPLYQKKYDMNNTLIPFLDRQREQSKIQKALNREASQLIVLYGRRRCGKSRLLTHMLDEGKDIYYHADRTDSTHQIELFSNQASIIFNGFNRATYPNWETVLLSLNDRMSERRVVCIDEFPYLVKSEPSLPSVLQRLIDTRQLKFDIILCGSSQQMMNTAILDSASPLYGRADEVIKILPLMPHYIQKALNINSVKAVEEYAIWGGVPRYWEIRLRHESLVEAVMEEVLNSDGLLYDEPSRLFLDEMRDLELSSSILSLVGNGCNRLSEIAARLERPATSLTTPISRLISYGYLQRELPYAELPKNSKRSLYKIADPFLNFYFHYVTPNRSLIEFRRQERLKDLLESSLSNYVANMWEHLCRQAIPLMTIEGMTFRPASRWWGTVRRNTTIELDVVSESDDGSTVLVGECKWSGRENVDQLRSSLLQRASQLPFLRGRRVLPLLFLKEKPKSDTPDGCLYPNDIIKQLT